MPTTQQRALDEELRQHMHETLCALIKEQVILALGKPGDLLQVKVHPLWKDRYRVNVLVGADAASPRFANSFFLAADGDGNIIASTPKIKKEY